MRDNRGSVVVEATLILPFFLFGMVALYTMGRAKMAELVVYEGCVEACEYMAEYGYISDTGAAIPYIKFGDYVDDEELLDRYVAGGADGVSFIGSIGVDDEGYAVLIATYDVNINLPFVPTLTRTKTLIIRQKAYRGYDDIMSNPSYENVKEYVYITPNQEVYHDSRTCSYLQMNIRQVAVTDAEKWGYGPCEYCGDSMCSAVYITEEGGRYHSSRSCTGLRRTVYRVEKSEVQGRPPCHRCAGE